MDGQPPPAEFPGGGVRPALGRSSLLQIRPRGAAGALELMTNTRFPCTVTTVRPRWVLGLTSIACFIVVLDSLVVVTALPRMPKDLHADLADLLPPDLRECNVLTPTQPA